MTAEQKGRVKVNTLIKNEAIIQKKWEEAKVFEASATDELVAIGFIFLFSN